MALLALSSKDVAFGGKGTLLTWERDAAGAVQARRTALGGPLLYPGSSLSWVGGRVLLASNVYNTGGGGSRYGQRLMLVTPGEGAVWALEAETGLRGAYPSPDGSLFVTVRDGSVPELRRVSDGRFMRALGAAVQDAVPLSGGRTLLAVQDGAGFGRIVRHRPGRLETLYRGPQVPEHLAANRDGTRIAAAGGKDGRTLRLLDASGRMLREWRAQERVSDLTFSPDGLVLSAALGWWGDSGVQAWRVADGAAYPLPQGAQFPVSQVVIRSQNGHQSPLAAVEWGTNTVLWKFPEKSSVWYSVPSPGGRWLAGTGLTPESTERIPPNRERGTVNRFARVDARTGRSGPVLSVPVAHPNDPYAGWGLAAFDGRRVLLSESSGDGCGAQLYGYRLADLTAGRTLNTPARLGQGYARLMGCGHYAPQPEADFAPDGRLLIRDGNRLDWWAL
ncbi:WD40 repeat domain-containing protein [Deinococcus sp. Marseille-Q6407]|uniref:WD40 repeat domain-containing protein n=1 Tax=Deinococcus sp. Marseille-Q6407 TaxID=2969223 RepID=UPI0021BF5433|nr:WD40 repeat domain-containing protein [Deinococcus sp. Marseille-Q6407]